MAFVQKLFKTKLAAKTDDAPVVANGDAGQKQKKKPKNTKSKSNLELRNGHVNGNVADDHYIRRPGDPTMMGVCLSPVEIPVEEALRLLAEDPPQVARSTPKGLVVDNSRWFKEREMQHCLYDKAVYDAMITKSLKTCELLQENLDSYITEVRKSPVSEPSSATAKY